MTFKQFEKAVADNKPEIIVSKHGDFCTNQSKTTLGVKFSENGKVYDYSGSYGDILGRLGIEWYTDATVKWYQDEIAMLQKKHGKKIFGKICDYSAKIEETRKELERVQTLYYIH